jgi:hypothetical protein
VEEKRAHIQLRNTQGVNETHNQKAERKRERERKPDRGQPKACFG